MRDCLRIETVLCSGTILKCDGGKIKWDALVIMIMVVIEYPCIVLFLQLVIFEREPSKIAGRTSFGMAGKET